VRKSAFDKISALVSELGIGDGAAAACDGDGLSAYGDGLSDSANTESSDTSAESSEAKNEGTETKDEGTETKDEGTETKDEGAEAGPVKYCYDPRDDAVMVRMAFAEKKRMKHGACVHHMNHGDCKFRSDCRYAHASSETQRTRWKLLLQPRSLVTCRHWKRWGKCKYGNKCKFAHPLADSAAAQKTTNGGNRFDVLGR